MAERKTRERRNSARIDRAKAKKKKKKTRQRSHVSKHVKNRENHEGRKIRVENALLEKVSREASTVAVLVLIFNNATIIAAS